MKTTTRLNLSGTPLAGGTALVTGASRGIGHEIALTLARAGADVIGIGRSPETLAHTKQEVEAYGVSFSPAVADLDDYESVRQAVTNATARPEKIRYLINVGGTISRVPLADVSVTDWDTVFNVNARATFFLCRDIGSMMFDHDGGAIINLGSLAAERTTGAAASYSASKAAVVTMTRVFAARFAPKVTVNAIGPGYVRTALNSEWLNDPNNENYVVNRTPARRLGTPGEVADLALYLTLPTASYLTGQHILLDGGWSAG